jgi:hypothetical protein
VSVAEHIAAEQALFLIALEDDDPEKVAALAHAAQCVNCSRLVRESQAMFQLLDQAAALPAISSQLEARVHAAVFAPQPARGLARLERIAWLILGVVSGLLIWHDGKPDLPLEPMVGLHCLRFELIFAAAAFATGVIATRLSGARALGPLRSAVIAMSGALVGQVLLRTHCEARDAALHLLVFHGLGVVLASSLGALAGRLISRPR